MLDFFVCAKITNTKNPIFSREELIFSEDI